MASKAAAVLQTNAHVRDNYLTSAMTAPSKATAILQTNASAAARQPFYECNDNDI